MITIVIVGLLLFIITSLAISTAFSFGFSQNTTTNDNRTQLMVAMQYQTNYYDRLINIAKLHNATQDQLDTLTFDKNVFTCMTYLLDTSFDWSNSLRLCDSVITDSIVSHSLGNNQTVLSYAHDYLKVRGIQ